MPLLSNTVVSGRQNNLTKKQCHLHFCLCIHKQIDLEFEGIFNGCFWLDNTKG